MAECPSYYSAAAARGASTALWVILFTLPQGPATSSVCAYLQRAGFLFSLECYKPLAPFRRSPKKGLTDRCSTPQSHICLRIHRCVRPRGHSLIAQHSLTERATAATPPTRDRKQNNCMPAETRPPRSVPSPPPKRRRDMPRADRGRQQLLDDLGYVQPIFRAGNSGDCTILKSVAVLLVVIGLVVFVGRFAE